jgi:SAM-dependent methyltransferase
MIERLLGLAAGRTIRMLEVGTGGGGIAEYFATHGRLDVEVDAVDVHDQRQGSGSYRFTLVHGTTLPFADGTFDVVITNHVIEHVGPREAQLDHLRELRRVMAPDGIGYLAVPNRWMVVEPHYRLPFLSWLPPAARTPYLRLARRGTWYDCEPLTKPAVEALFVRAGLDATNLCLPAARLTLELEGSDSMLRSVVARVPRRLVPLFDRMCPTLIYRFSRRIGSAS